MPQISDLDSDYFEGIQVTAEWIRDLGESSNIEHKKKIIERALIASRLGSTNAQCFLYNCFLAYNPYFVYRVTNVKRTHGLYNRPNPWIKFWGLLEDLRTEQFSHVNFQARKEIENLSKEFDSDEWNCVAIPVLLKAFDESLTIDLLNSVLKNTEWEIPVFSCQMARDCEHNTRDLFGKKWLEPKVAGTRVLCSITFSTVILYNEEGIFLEGYDNIEDSIRDNADDILAIAENYGIKYGGVVLDGVIVTSENSNAASHIEPKNVVPLEDSVYNIFDVVPFLDFTEGYSEIKQCFRNEIVHEMTKILHERTTNVRTLARAGIEVNLSMSEGHNIMHRYAQDILKNGFGGILIKDLDAPYICKDSPFWLRWHPVTSVVLNVIGVNPTAVAQEEIPKLSLTCHGHDVGREILVELKNGFSDELRQKIWENRNKIVGNPIEISCESVFKADDGTYKLVSPKFSKFKGFTL